ncbi:MAG: FAD/NAD(P)-binding protein [Solirubrobacteraceae bacterium]
MLSIAIVGLGPWGACALERIVTTARGGLPAGARVVVHVIEPGRPGSGVYETGQPDYLLLNNPCGQLSLYPVASDGDRPPYGMGLYEWAVAQGYRYVGDRCLITAAGRPIEPHDFLPRRLMGEYLSWVYETLVASAPPQLQIVYHPAQALDIRPRRGGREEIQLADGASVAVDHVILTSGHTANRQTAANDSGPTQLAPYPVAGYVTTVAPRSTVGISGMGLVAIDVAIALTVGRGGRFVEHGDGLRYLASGSEPMLEMFSRSGLPFTAKSVTGTDRTDVYRPVICTPDALDRVSGRSNGHRRAVDVRSELLPLLYGEMYARYYAQAAFHAQSRAAAAAVRDQLCETWGTDRREQTLARLRETYGSFDAEALFFGHPPDYDSRQEYERCVRATLADDLHEAEVPDGASPLKCAAEVLRIFRDPMRSVVEQGGLTRDSYLDFHTRIRGRIHRLVAGPPALRSRQLLALIDAGVLRTPYGPAPTLESSGPQGPTRISSTAFAQTHAGTVDLLIRGHLDEPRIGDSASELLSRLYARGRISQFRYDEVPVGSIHLTAESHPIDARGWPQDRIWVFGVLTEGVRHFTHYIPSPKSRIRAFEDLGTCVGEILGELDDSGELRLPAVVAEPLGSAI